MPNTYPRFDGIVDVYVHRGTLVEQVKVIYEGVFP